MPGRSRAWLKTVAGVAAVLSLTLNFGIVDFVDGFTGFVDEARNQVLDVGWGAMFGVIVPFGLLPQLLRPERRIAGLQQTVAVVFVLALTGAVAGEWGYLRLAAVLAVVCALLVALHPARGELFRFGGRRDPVLITSAAVATTPFLIYAWKMTTAQRHNLPPADAVSNGLHHWTVMATLAVLVPLLVLLAAAGTSGWRIPLTSACLAACAWAISCLLAGAAGSEGHVWASLVLTWAATTFALGLRPRPGEGRPAEGTLAA